MTNVAQRSSLRHLLVLRTKPLLLLLICSGVLGIVYTQSRDVDYGSFTLGRSSRSDGLREFEGARLEELSAVTMAAGSGFEGDGGGESEGSEGSEMGTTTVKPLGELVADKLKGSLAQDMGIDDGSPRRVVAVASSNSPSSTSTRISLRTSTSSVPTAGATNLRWTIFRDEPTTLTKLASPLAKSATTSASLTKPTSSKQGVSRLDVKLCSERGLLGCAFLVVGHVSSSESTAQQQIYQLGLMAMALGRTLVLPNVGKEIGTCAKNPFDFHYSASALLELGIEQTVTRAQYLQWTKARVQPPSVQIVHLAQNSTSKLGAVEIETRLDPATSTSGEDLCLDKGLSFVWSPLTLTPPARFSRGDALRWAQGVLRTLTSRVIAAESYRGTSKVGEAYFSDAAHLSPDILVLDFSFTSPFLSPELVAPYLSPSLPSPPLVFHSFPYAPTWVEYATRLAGSLSPFIAVQWTVGDLPESQHLPCSRALSDRLKKIKMLYPLLENVFLSTDRHALVKEVEGMRLTNFRQEMLADRVTKPGAEVVQMDQGLLEIIEKVVSTQAEIFLTAFASETIYDDDRICGSLSETTAQIVDSRRTIRTSRWAEGEEIEMATGMLWNGASYFSLD